MGGRIRRALPASTRNQLWLTGLFLALLALFMMTGARAFLAWPMYESLLSTLPLYGFLALGLTLVVAAGEMDLCFPSPDSALRSRRYTRGRSGSASSSPS